MEPEDFSEMGEGFTPTLYAGGNDPRKVNADAVGGRGRTATGAVPWAR